MHTGLTGIIDILAPVAGTKSTGSTMGENVCIHGETSAGVSPRGFCSRLTGLADPTTLVPGQLRGFFGVSQIAGIGKANHRDFLQTEISGLPA